MNIMVTILFGILARLFMPDKEPKERPDIRPPSVEGNPPCFFLCLDNSGSMENRDAGENVSRREAGITAAGGTVRYIAENCPEALVGIGSFADEFHHVTGPFVVGENLDIIEGDLENLGPDGNTAMGPGLRGMEEMFEQCPAGSEKVLLLLTDGRANEGENPVQVAEELHGEGIDIHTLGIGSRKGTGEPVNEKDLRRIASTPEQYKRLENWDPASLLKELKKIAQIIFPEE